MDVSKTPYPLYYFSYYYIPRDYPPFGLVRQERMRAVSKFVKVYSNVLLMHTKTAVNKTDMDMDMRITYSKGI